MGSLHKIATAIKLVTSPKLLVIALKRNLSRFRIYIANDRPFVYRTFSGDDFACVPRSRTSAQLYYDRGYCEITESKLCQDWLQPGDYCIDGGANVGQYATLFARATGPEGRVIAVEAVPDTVEILSVTLEALKLSRVVIEEAALSDTEGFSEFSAAGPHSSDVSASLKPHDLLTDHQTLTVKTLTIDRLISLHRLDDRLALIKIDIEGAEPMALAGASKLFSSPQPPLFLIEIHRATLAAFGFTPKDITKYFPLDRFELYHVQRSTSDLLPGESPGQLQRLRNPDSYNWPWLSNLIALPLHGQYAHRRSYFAKSLPF